MDDNPLARKKIARLLREIQSRPHTEAEISQKVRQQLTPDDMQVLTGMFQEMFTGLSPLFQQLQQHLNERANS
jgi:hypothetical protein